MTDYPYLLERVVLVDGYKGTGVYDLNSGTFHRVTISAGRLLRGVDGTRALSSYGGTELAFISDCMAKGFVDLQAETSRRQQTPLESVLRPLRPVRFAWIEITSRCNQLCRHCFLGEELNRFAPFSVAEVEEMLTTLHEAGARQVIISGGEPTGHPHFNEILEIAGSRFPFKLSLLSNGSHGGLLKAIELLQRYEVTVKIPLLGWGASHDRMAGKKGGFERTILTIRKLKEAGVLVELGTTVTGINHRDIPEVRSFADHLGLRLEVSPLYAVGYAQKNRDELFSISQEEILDVCRSDKERAQKSLVSLPRRKSSKLSGRYQVEPTDYDAVNLRDYLTPHSECGQKIVAILSSREVTACLMLRDKKYSLGSLYDHSLKAILSHSTREAKLFDALMELARVPGCGGCEARYVCKAGGCPASALAFSGSVQLKNPLFRNCYYLERHEPAAVL